MIDITGLDKRSVLAALYNSSKPQGMGFMPYDSADMTVEEAGEELARGTCFDYLKGRVMKVQLDSNTEFNECLYDRDNGEGAAQRAIDRLRSGDSDSVRKEHKEAVRTEAAATHNRLHQQTTHRDGVVTLGLDDVKDPLKKALDRAVDALDQDNK